MIFTGTVKKHGKFWIASVPAFEADTQGRTKQEAYAMINDWFASILDDASLVETFPLGTDKLVIKLQPTKEVFALLLQRQRLKSGLSIRDVAKLLGFKSPNAYAAYEKGKREPSFSLASKLMKAVSKQDQLELCFASE